MSGEIEKINETKQKLDAVSPSFCLAKWLQVTIRLQNGTAHSCHHPEPHKIRLQELDRDPSALHNTSYKKEQRRLMLSGQRPSECSYCWDIEDLPGAQVSDRHVKSNDFWAAPHMRRVASLGWSASIDPTYLEISFSNTCNFKCAYCDPLVSSKWAEEIRVHGPYRTSEVFNDVEFMRDQDLMPIPESEPNPYADAFWKWWPKLAKNLEVFRITGGEPLLSPHTFRVLESIDQVPMPGLELAVNSNLGVPAKLIEKFADSLERLVDGGKIKNVRIYTSLDAWGLQAEYIRHGLDFESFWGTVRYLLKRLPKVQIVFMCTFNALSVTSFRPFLEAVAGLKEEFFSEERHFKTPVILDVSYLRHPEFLSVKILPERFLVSMRDLLGYMESLAEERYKPYRGFYDFERAKMKRLIEYAQRPENPLWIKKARDDFRLFIAEHDRRRGTDFAATFPELRVFE